MPLDHLRTYWTLCCQEGIHKGFIDKTKKVVVYLTPNEKYLEEVCQELIKVKSEIFA